MSVEKRMIVAVVISTLVIVVWNLLFVPPPVEVPEEQQQEGAPGEAAPAELTEGEGQQEVTPEEEAVLSSRPEGEIVAEQARSVTVRSPLFEVRLTNSSGGSAQSWLINKPDGEYYKPSFPENGERLDLVAPERYRPEGLLPLATMLRSGDGNYRQLPGLAVLSTDHGDAGEIELSGADTATVTFEYQSGGNVWVRKSFTFHADNYLVDVEMTADVEGADAVMILGPGVGELLKLEKPEAETSKLVKGMEGNGYVYRKSGGTVQRIPADVSDQGEAGEPFKEDRVPEIVEWAGVENQYFMTLAAGGGGTLFNYVWRLTASKTIEGAEEAQTFYLPYIGIKPDNGARFRLFAGPKDLEMLEQPAYGDLQEVVQFGWFSFISRPGLWILKQLYAFTSNYGFSIILLTLLINIILLPLSIKQRKSMQEMQRIQPEIKQIQAKYKVEKGDSAEARQNKKKLLNEETMALYKAEGVNPMGGCLPMLLQFPILFALFDMFRVAIELRQAPFIFWIQDLSNPDPLMITPIMMGITMFLSQKATPMSTESGGAAMKLMPLLFVMMMMNVASGLVIYWFTSNLCNLGFQGVMQVLKPMPKASEKSGKKQIPGKGGGKSKKKSRR